MTRRCLKSEPLGGRSESELICYVRVGERPRGKKEKLQQGDENNLPAWEVKVRFKTRRFLGEVLEGSCCETNRCLKGNAASGTLARVLKNKVTPQPMGSERVGRTAVTRQT